MSLPGARGLSGWTWSTVLLSGLLLLIAALYAGVIFRGNPTFRDFWFPVFLYLFPVLALLLRPNTPGVGAFTALFASLSVLFFQIFTGDPFFIPGLPERVDRLVKFLSESLILLFPFTFVHFSLVFPTVGPWIQRRVRYIPFFIYGPLGALLVLNATLAGTGYEPLDSEYIVFPLGFLLGLGIFLRSYFYSLTSAEKNRLRVMLAGCLAGGLPLILANLADLYQDLALLLLPLFPLSLALAVFKQDFARWPGSYVGSSFPVSIPEQSGATAMSTAPFEPISPNPYLVGNPVRTPDMFFGRVSDFEFIRGRLDGQRHGCVVLLAGERRAGKTSILYQILNGRLGPDILPVFLDMQEMVVQNDREFVNALAVRVRRATEGRATPPASSLARKVEDYLQLTTLFERIMAAIEPLRLLLLFDEYELISEKVRDGRLSPEVGDYLNSLLERHARLNMVFTGSRPLEADPIFARLLGKSSFREISFLALPDAVKLICSPLQGRASFERQAISDLILLTRGHPFFVQLLCQFLVELLNESRKVVVKRDLVAQAVARVLESPPPQLLYKWGAYGRPERLVLAGLGTLLRRPGSYLPADRLNRLILSLPPDHRKDLDTVKIRIVLEDLRRKGTLDRDQDRYGFTMDLLRRYIKAEHTVWSVLGEK